VRPKCSSSTYPRSDDLNDDAFCISLRSIPRDVITHCATENGLTDRRPWANDSHLDAIETEPHATGSGRNEVDDPRWFVLDRHQRSERHRVGVGEDPQRERFESVQCALQFDDSLCLPAGHIGRLGSTHILVSLLPGVLVSSPTRGVTVRALRGLEIGLHSSDQLREQSDLRTEARILPSSHGARSYHWQARY
jgi:hypothetical protein